MTISAKFIGHHGSLGYSRGRRYTLYVENRVVTRLFSRRNYILIERAEGGGRCVYDSLNALLSNWRGLKVLSTHNLKKIT